MTFAQVEPLVRAWLSTTTVAPLVTRPDGGLSVFLAMPSSSPVPAIIITRLGGGPAPRKDLPEDQARMSFDCWGANRAQVAGIAYAVISELDALARRGGYTSDNATLAAAEVLSLVWQPDPESDTARYVVDALITTLAT